MRAALTLQIDYLWLKPDYQGCAKTGLKIYLVKQIMLFVLLSKFLS